MINNYHKFIIEGLRDAMQHCSPEHHTIKAVLVNALEMVDREEFNNWMAICINTFTPEIVPEQFHKNFRQIGVTENANLDMIIWHCMSVDTDILKMIKFIVQYPEKFVELNTKQIVEDYFWDADF